MIYKNRKKGGIKKKKERRERREKKKKKKNKEKENKVKKQKKKKIKCCFIKYCNIILQICKSFITNSVPFHKA